MQKSIDDSLDIDILNRLDMLLIKSRRVVLDGDIAKAESDKSQQENHDLRSKVRELESKNRELEKKYKEEIDYSTKLVKIVGNKIKQTNKTVSAKAIIEELIVEIDNLVTQLES